MEGSKIELQIDAKQTITIETPQGWDQINSVREDRPGFFGHSRNFSEAVEAIRPVIDQAIQPLKGLEVKPKEIELEFGFSFGSNSELILQKGGGNSHIHVTLKYDALG